MFQTDLVSRFEDVKSSNCFQDNALWDLRLCLDRNRRLQSAERIITASIDLLHLKVEAEIWVVGILLGCGYLSGIDSDWTSLGGSSLDWPAEIRDWGEWFIGVDVGNVEAFPWVKGLVNFLPPLMTCGVGGGQRELILAFIHVVGVEFNLGGGSVFAVEENVCLRVGGFPVGLDLWLVLSGQS